MALLSSSGRDRNVEKDWSDSGMEISDIEDECGLSDKTAPTLDSQRVGNADPSTVMTVQQLNKSE